MPQGYVPLPGYLLAKVLVVELKLVALFLTLLQLCEQLLQFTMLELLSLAELLKVGCECFELGPELLVKFFMGGTCLLVVAYLVQLS